jgi:hypothetical protein
MGCKKRCEELGFDFIHYMSRERVVRYRCVCGNENDTSAPNLLRKGRKAQCLKCQNIPFRNDLEDVKRDFKEHGCELLSEYTSRHKPVKYRCVCGGIAEIRYADFKRGKRCQNCKTVKFKDTCLDRYGVENVFQLEEVKEKSKETRLKKHGDKN